MVAGVLIDGCGVAGFTAAGGAVALVACTTVKGLFEGAEGALAGVFWSGVLSGAAEFAWPKQTKMAAKNAIVPQVSL